MRGTVRRLGAVAKAVRVEGFGGWSPFDTESRPKPPNPKPQTLNPKL